MCNCPEIIVLYAPKVAFEAKEEWCTIHGYQNGCYMCHSEQGLGVFFSTELCVRHRNYWRKAIEV